VDCSSGSSGDDERYQDWYRYREIRKREFQILGAATLKLQEPNDVRINGAERRLVLESLGNEWNDRHARMNAGKPVGNNEEYGMWCLLF